MNTLVSVARLKARSGLPSSTLPDEGEILRVLDEVTAEIEGPEGANRKFYSEVATKYPLYRGETLRDFTPILWVPDLVSITTLKVDVDGDGVFELTLAANVDYWLYPLNPNQNEPYLGVMLIPGGQLGAWPLLPRRTQIVGLWGYSDEVETTGATTSEDVDLSETVIDISSYLLLSPGDTIRLDSEDMRVTAVTDAATDTATVVRAVNGTTAALHTSGTTIYRRRFARNAEAACLERAISRWRGRAPADDAWSDTPDSYAKFRGLVNSVRRTAGF